MGKKKFSNKNVSKSLSEMLGIDGLSVLKNKSTEDCFYVVNKQYFEGAKYKCPACHSENTRSSKVNVRKFKDILIEKRYEDDKPYDYVRKNDFRIVDLVFYQRWFRCNDCKQSVFPEPINFAEKGCHFTNRLADKLADGTFQNSYNDVCEYYGVPSSKASVGTIMRRRIQFRESQLIKFKTPDIISFVEIDFYSKHYPVVLGIDGQNIYCIDILKDTYVDTYITYLRTLDLSEIKMIYIEPNDELIDAIATCLPSIKPAISIDCIILHAMKAFAKIIRSDGKQLKIKDKYHTLLRDWKFQSQYKGPDSKPGELPVIRYRERLSKAYKKYQGLYNINRVEKKLDDWVASIKKCNNLNEFEDLLDIIELYSNEISEGFNTNYLLPNAYVDRVREMIEAIDNMPYCIFDVLRARCMFVIPNKIVNYNGEERRIGIPISNFKNNIEAITKNIKERRLYNDIR